MFFSGFSFSEACLQILIWVLVISLCYKDIFEKYFVTIMYVLYHKDVPNVIHVLLMKNVLRIDNR